MRDNLRRYRAIRSALTQWYPGEPTGNVARHLTTLAALISGIVGSKSTQLPTLATKVPDGNKPESRVKRFARWVGNDHATPVVLLVYRLAYTLKFVHPSAAPFDPGRLLSLSMSHFTLADDNKPLQRG